MLNRTEALCDLCEIIDIQTVIIRELYTELEQFGASEEMEERLKLAKEKYDNLIKPS